MSDNDAQTAASEGQPSEEQPSEVAAIFLGMTSRFKPGALDRPTTFCFAIDDESWTVIIDPQRCQVFKGRTVEDADCFLKTSAEIFLGTIRGTYKPGMIDLVSGKVKTNNPFLLQSFKDSFAE